MLLENPGKAKRILINHVMFKIPKKCKYLLKITPISNHILSDYKSILYFTKHFIISILGKGYS